MTNDLAEALERANKLREPTPAELGLPDNALALYALEDLSCSRGAWSRYWRDRAVPAEQKKKPGKARGRAF